jgi:hypothetical protein
MSDAKPCPLDTNLIVYKDGRVWNTKKSLWQPTHFHSDKIRIKVHVAAIDDPKLRYRLVMLTHNWRDDHEEFDVHHINLDPADDRFENLIWVPKDVHRKLHK